MPQPDIIVVGAGIVGTCIALSLLQAGCKVTLLESDFAGGGTTGAAMGHLVAMDDSPVQLNFTRDSIQRWQQLAGTLPEECEVQWPGTLWIAMDPSEMERAAARLRGYQQAGVSAELVDSRGLKDLEPALRPGLPGGLLVAGDGVCYPPGVVTSLSQRLRNRGAIVRERCTAEKIAPGRVVLQDGEQLSAAVVVIATGVQAPRLLPELPIIPRRGHLVITDQHSGLIHHQLVESGYLRSAHSFDGASVAFNIQPRPNGQLLIGSSRELVGFTSGLNRPLLRQMLNRAVELVPGLRGTRALRSWTGYRPATPDKLPLIGPWGGDRSLWVAAGHEGLGITMALTTAELVAAGILGTRPPVDPSPFLPDRQMPEWNQAK